MSRIINNPAAALTLAEALAGLRPDEDPIIVGGYDDCDPCQMPFGGRDVGGGTTSVGDRAAAAMPAGDRVFSLLQSLGAHPCRVWGAEPPGSCRDEDTGCVPGKKICGAILPYRAAAGAAATDYTLKAKKWFWPLLWVDSSAETVLINTFEFQGDSIFENGEGSGALRPRAIFPSDGTNFVPGLPAIDMTSGLDFNIVDSAGGAVTFEGVFIGVSIRN